MEFVNRHMTWFMGLGLIGAIYAAYRLFGSQITRSGPTADEIAAQGTVTPGTPIYAPSGVGYGVPGEYESNTNVTANPAIGSLGNWFSDFAENLNSGANSTAPSNFAPIVSVPNAYALGLAAVNGSTTITDKKND